MSKDNLIDIIKEYEFTIYTVLSESGEQAFHNSAAEGLEEKLRKEKIESEVIK